VSVELLAQESLTFYEALGRARPLASGGKGCRMNRYPRSASMGSERFVGDSDIDPIAAERSRFLVRQKGSPSPQLARDRHHP